MKLLRTMLERTFRKRAAGALPVPQMLNGTLFITGPGDPTRDEVKSFFGLNESEASEFMRAWEKRER